MNTESHFNGITQLDDQVRTLRTLSRAFARTGNIDVSDELWNIAAQLSEAKDEIEKSFHSAFDAYTNAVNQGTANMLKAALYMADPSLMDDEEGE